MRLASFFNAMYKLFWLLYIYLSILINEKLLSDNGILMSIFSLVFYFIALMTWTMFLSTRVMV